MCETAASSHVMMKTAIIFLLRHPEAPAFSPAGRGIRRAAQLKIHTACILPPSFTPLLPSIHVPMKRIHKSVLFPAYVFLVLFAFLPALLAENKVMGEIVFVGLTKVEKTSGVWVDGQYVGYLKELKGNKKVLLLPGDHTISVRQNGYVDFNKTVMLKPGEKQIVNVAMIKAATGLMPATWAILKIAVNPPRAAVFLDGRFVGHVSEFEGLGRSLQVVPGAHSVKIALPGYQTFETSVNPSANQKVEIRTNLLKSSVPVNDPSLGNDSPEHPTEPPPPPEPQR